MPNKHINPETHETDLLVSEAGGDHQGSHSPFGEVEFRAHFRRDGEPDVLHERSRFVREGGRWFYLDGVHRASGEAR